MWNILKGLKTYIAAGTGILFTVLGFFGIVPQVGKDEVANAIIVIVIFLTQIFQRTAISTSPEKK